MKYEFGNVATEIDDFKLDDNVENAYNDGSRWLLWSKSTYKCYLGEDEGEKVQVSVVEAAGNGVGQGGDARRQRAGVHPSAKRMCSSARASTAAKSTWGR